jgi:D-lactate dehydrogenase
MEVAVYSTYKFERDVLLKANAGKHTLRLLETALTIDTAVLATGASAVCLFVSDDGSDEVLKKLAAVGIKFIALRSAGFNHVDIKAASRLNIRVARVATYSPNAIAEYAVALMLELNRKIVRASNRVHDLNFSLDGLTGFDMNGKTVGIIGTGNIGTVVAKILHGFGCKILAVDQVENKSLAVDCGVSYTDYNTLFQHSDIITLHLPLTPDTKYLINAEAIAKMKRGVMLINTGRGALINTKEVIAGLKTGQIGYLGLDVYEEESGLFFEDHSEDMLQDETISRLLTFKNVLITGHQAFLTETALQNIAETTIETLDCFEQGTDCIGELK